MVFYMQVSDTNFLNKCIITNHADCTRMVQDIKKLNPLAIVVSKHLFKFGLSRQKYAEVVEIHKAVRC